MTNWGEQLDLFDMRNGFPHPPPAHVQEVEKLALKILRSRGLEVTSVRWKKNRRVMASIGKNGVLHLHKIYQRADIDDLKALADVMSGKVCLARRRRFYEFIEKNLPREIGEGRTLLTVMPPKGLFHDLDRALGKLLPLLGRDLDPMPVVGWSPARVGRRGITWGTHRDTPYGPLILVNAVLDDPDIPGFVVEHIVWHEICHQAIPPENGSNGRRKVHSRAFRQVEQRFPKLPDAETWEQSQVARLIRRHYRRGRNHRR